MATGGNALQQRRTLSHRASRLMRLRPGVGVEPRLVRLKGSPIDEAGVMIWDENGPLINGQMTHPLPDDTLFIYVAFAPSLAVGVSASIHRIGKDGGGVRCKSERPSGSGQAGQQVHSVVETTSPRNGTRARPGAPNRTRRSVRRPPGRRR